MKKDPGLVHILCLMVGDALAIVVAFLFAYLVRTRLDSRPFYFEPDTFEFTSAIAILVPVWWIVLALLGLYRPSVYNRSRLPELGRIFAASVIGMMVLITYDFFFGRDLFPVRSVAAWALIFCLVSLTVVRTVLRFLHRQVSRRRNSSGLGVIIVGNSKNTERLLEHIADFPEDGYRIKGIVAGSSYVPAEFRKFCYPSLQQALDNAKADVIFQTDESQSEYVYAQSIKYHLLYYFVPAESALSSHIGNLELVGDTPAILVKVTPLIGGARVLKRACDIIFSLLILILALIPMLLIWLVLKLSDPKHPAIYSEYRLSRYNSKVKIFKFRSMKPTYSGLSPEAAFRKMGQPELIDQYRKGGDYLKNDPRITKIGHFLRETSLDELPQLINVLKGDISLVGPRALVPGELRNYGDRSLLLSVKSGLTGLAQVSGRRDISFEERRALDLYYVQNWSLRLDLQILLRTVAVVFTRKGAK